MAGSGPGGYTSVHRIFVNSWAVTKPDGSAITIEDMAVTEVRTSCLICGALATNLSWPRGDWRHASPEEIARYASEEAQRP